MRTVIFRTLEVDSTIKGFGQMKISQPKPFFFEGGKRAVLMLHGFTGNSADVRMMGRFLEKSGYTCYAPQYKGHGVPPEELVGTGPTDWWKDVMRGYDFLRVKGYEEIAVVGLSLGGVFSLKLGYTVPVKGIVPMCAPMYMKSEETMYKGVLEYAREYKKNEGKDEAQINEEMDKFTPMDTLEALRQLISDVKDQLSNIKPPLYVVQARHDKMINTDSANIIFNNVASDNKELKWYENSGHVITLDKEREMLNHDVLAFLNGLDWQQ